MALAIVAIWAAAIVFSLAQLGVATRLVSNPPPLRPYLVEDVVFLLLWCAGTPAILWSATWLPLDHRRWLRHAAAHLALASAFFILVNLTGHTLTRLLLGEPVTADAIWRTLVLAFSQVFHLALIVYAFILGVGHLLAIRSARRAAELRAERLRADLAEAQLRALRLQLQPHFLLNALNAVGSLILTDRSTEAFEVVGRLGELLRALLATDQHEEVSLRDELDLTEAYVAIEEARLGARLRSDWEIAPDVAGAQLPPMLLQPLVENAIRHGIARRPDGGQLIVRATRGDGRLRLEVCDDGPGPVDGDAEGTGIGLENTRRRLEHLYGGDQRLELERAGQWTRVVVELPFHIVSASGGVAA